MVLQLEVPMVSQEAINILLEQPQAEILQFNIQVAH
jgi:hypothetical protein